MKPKDSPDNLDTVRKLIRDRIVPPAAMINDRNIPAVESTRQLEGDYEKDLEKLRALTKDQLKELLSQVEEKSREDQGIFSRGDLLNGYAIHKETLEALQSSNHQGVDFDLMIKIVQNLAKIRDESEFTLPSTEEEWAIRRRIVQGTVYLQVPGFKTPIVKLFLGSTEMGNKVQKEDVERIVKYLKNEKSLLPVSSTYQTL